MQIPPTFTCKCLAGSADVQNAKSVWLRLDAALRVGEKSRAVRTYKGTITQRKHIVSARRTMREAHTQRNGKYGRLARAAELARAAVEKECPAELLEAAFGLPRCVAMLLSCVIVLRLLIALAAEVCWRSKCAQAAACGHEGTLEQLSAGCRRLRMASGRPGAARCLSLGAIYNKRNGFAGSKSG